MSHPAKFARQLVHNTSGPRTHARRTEVGVFIDVYIAVHSGAHFTLTYVGVNVAMSIFSNKGSH
jgi:hypothetical protein